MNDGNKPVNFNTLLLAATLGLMTWCTTTTYNTSRDLVRMQVTLEYRANTIERLEKKIDGLQVELEQLKLKVRP